MSFWQSFKQSLGINARGPLDRDLEDLQDLMGYHFRDDGLLILGLTHRSHARSTGQDQPSNERLEFLGDSVLGLVISDQLYKDHPEELEGNLTKTKAMLVNETTLSTIARELGINAFVRLSPEEERSGGKERASIVSDAFESIIGAVYLDGGLDAARDVVLRLIYTRKGRIVTDSAQRNYKGDLLELMQARGDTIPRYDVIQEEGPDHEKTFHVVVSIGGQKIGEGVGLSKKEAEQKAACRALEQLSIEP
ncbi:ribonuclease III [candidate division GN15 bacterium]|uniref:Ribonuclease 3 n=1 Tax=candidate division GN15 bacterium TaxID=2072418 RepID=A0A855X4A7_9BACT|nr:MAG: ribonuclease III [candidate division GN15 bacterium]